ncbi:MAG: endolytic transglycosylase MltG [Magnetococcales bacterium]|nr:endolytic transglycosylase MltG [Magnetococcales bacterium]
MKNSKILKVLGVVMAILGVMAGAVGLHFYLFYSRPVPETKVIDIQKGWRMVKIADALEEAGVVSSSFWLLALVKASGNIIIKAGEYRIEQGKLPSAIIAQLQSGTGMLPSRFVVPEGLSAKEIVALMVKRGWKDATRLMQGTAFLQKMQIEGNSLEGWLYPDTYFYRNKDTAVSMMRRMVVRSKKVLYEEWEKRPKDFTLTPYQALVLASVVEKETGQAVERPLIAGVFHNRLRRDMMLQSDPTVIYGIADFDGNITRKHLTTPTPYNTYTRKGLPPTPICNPGRASIHAVFHPDETKAFYFVASGNGSHIFSNTLEEHERYVDIYQRHKRRQ